MATPQHRRDRYHRIASVLMRHGLGFLAAGLDLERLVPASERTPHVSGRAAQARQLRLALEELGPTFVKLGQVLSTRRDLLPPEFVAELERLQDEVPPVPFDEIEAVLEAELGAPPSAVFASLEERPLASASLGQAYAATMPDGTEVVVKVRRPGAVPTVQEDLEILQNLADRASRTWHVAADYDLPALAAGFARTLRAELDYLREARNAERFAEDFAHDPAVRIPRVHWAAVTSRVLTLERVHGAKIDDLAALDAAGVDRTALVRTAIDAIAQMVFVDGFFHADPHPGNLFVESADRIALIDFGMVGRLDADLRDRLGAVFLALVGQDAARLAAALVGLAESGHVDDRSALRAELERFIALYAGRPLGEVQVAPLLGRLLAILRRYRLHLPPDVVALIRLLLLVDGIGVGLDPSFNLAEALQPYATRVAAARFSPEAVARRAVAAGKDAAYLGLELPKRLRRILETVDEDGFALHLRAAELEPLMGRAERIGNRLVVGMITAAVIGAAGRVASPASAGGAAPAARRAVVGTIGVLGGYLAWTGRRRRP